MKSPSNIILILWLVIIIGVALFQLAVNYTQPLPLPTQTKVIKTWTETKPLNQNYFLSTPEGVFDISREDFSRVTPGQTICLKAEKRNIILKPDIRVMAPEACH